jgi:hypothetical protein
MADSGEATSEWGKQCPTLKRRDLRRDSMTSNVHEAELESTRVSRSPRLAERIQKSCNVRQMFYSAAEAVGRFQHSKNPRQ